MLPPKHMGQPLYSGKDPSASLALHRAQIHFCFLLGLAFIGAPSGSGIAGRGAPA